MRSDERVLQWMHCVSRSKWISKWVSRRMRAQVHRQPVMGQRAHRASAALLFVFTTQMRTPSKHATFTGLRGAGTCLGQQDHLAVCRRAPFWRHSPRGNPGPREGEIIEKKKEAGEVEMEAALTACQDRKREGDRRFGHGDFEAAAEIYRDALNQLTAGEALAGGCWSETAKSARMLGVMKTILLQNCAACCHKLENFAEAIDLCTAALEFEPRAEQAVLQRARCLLAIGDDGAAYRDYMELAVAKPEALEPRRQMQAIEARNPGIAAVAGTMTPLPDVPHCGGLRESFLQSLVVLGMPMPSRHASADGVGCRDLPAAHVG